MPEDRTENGSGQGLGWLGLSIVGALLALASGVIGLMQLYGDELDPCINADSIPCPSGPAKWFVIAAIIGVPAVVGLAIAISKRAQK